MPRKSRYPARRIDELDVSVVGIDGSQRVIDPDKRKRAENPELKTFSPLTFNINRNSASSVKYRDDRTINAFQERLEMARKKLDQTVFDDELFAAVDEFRVTPDGKGVIPNAFKQQHIARAGRDVPLSARAVAVAKAMARDGVSFNAAWRMAGYSKKPDARLRESAQFKAIMEYERTQWQRAADMTRREVIEGFREAIAIARRNEDAMVLVAAWREIGRMTGLYDADKVEVTHNVNLTRESLEKMTDDQLVAMMEASERHAAVDALREPQYVPPRVPALLMPAPPMLTPLAPAHPSTLVPLDEIVVDDEEDTAYDD